MAMKILVAEDEPHIVECLRFLLTRDGFEMRAVSDGLSIFPALGEEKPDLLILDVMLPEMNGFDVLRRVREESATKHLPVLVLTAKGQDADRTRILELGANAFITKPFSNSDLMASVRKIAGQTVKNSDGEPSEEAKKKA